VSRLRALRLLPLLLAAVVAGGAAGAVEARPVATAPNDAAMEKLERIVRARVDSRRTTGIVAGMVFPDGETRVFAYGSAGGGKRLTASSVFEIGSITKVFTATVLADMVQRGDVRLTDPVSSLLPPNVKVPSRNGRAITLEDLATHSSGLPREATNSGRRTRTIRSLATTPPVRRPSLGSRGLFGGSTDRRTRGRTNDIRHDAVTTVVGKTLASSRGQRRERHAPSTGRSTRNRASSFLWVSGPHKPVTP
jgi:CubicO group peptidase (beta-lactamase class C family)